MDGVSELGPPPSGGGGGVRPRAGRRSPAYAGAARSASSRLAHPNNRHSRVRFLANPRYRTCA